MTVLSVGFERKGEGVIFQPSHSDSDVYVYVLLEETGPGFTSVHVREKMASLFNCSSALARRPRFFLPLTEGLLCRFLTCLSSGFFLCKMGMMKLAKVPPHTYHED